MLKMKPTLRILLVEDIEENIKAARSYFNRSGSDVIVYAKDYEDAMDRLVNDKNYNGVITDLFFPEKKGSGKIDLGIELLKEAEETHRKNKVSLFGSTWGIYAGEKEELENQFPLGVLIARYCKENDFPFLIVTEGDRHEGNLGYVRFTLLAPKDGQFNEQERARFIDYRNIFDIGHNRKCFSEIWEEAYTEFQRLLQKSKESSE